MAYRRKVLALGPRGIRVRCGGQAGQQAAGTWQSRKLRESEPDTGGEARLRTLRVHPHDSSSKATLPKSPQAEITDYRGFRYLSLWGHFSFKLPGKLWRLLPQSRKREDRASKAIKRGGRGGVGKKGAQKRNRPGSESGRRPPQ